MPGPVGGEEAVPVRHDPPLQQQQGEQEDRPSDVSLAGQSSIYLSVYLSIRVLMEPLNS